MKKIKQIIIYKLLDEKFIINNHIDGISFSKKCGVIYNIYFNHSDQYNMRVAIEIILKYKSERQIFKVLKNI